MLGAIIGDIAGSKKEVEEVLAQIKGSKIPYTQRIKILNKEVPLLEKDAYITDDTVLTVAIADALLNSKDYKYYLKKYGKKEQNLGVEIIGRSLFGEGFIKWLYDDSYNNSWGNGCAMRISPIAYYYNDIEEIKRESYKATITSHNHVDSIKCAEAVCMAIFFARKKCTKRFIKQYIEEHYFSLDFNLEDLQRNYESTSKAIDSVPQAIFAFIVSNNFEDAIRKALCIGGDTDTIACIAGSIAEAYFPIDPSLIEKALTYVPDYMLSVIDKFYKVIK